VNESSSKYEAAWVWVTRACAVVGFVYLLATVGFTAPWGAYILLIGLFFGPDVLLRAFPQITSSTQSKEEGK
jgi:hypothetical protein